MTFYYDPLDRRCKSQTGAIARGSEVTFHIFREDTQKDASFCAEVCYLVLYQDGKKETILPMEKREDGFSLTLKFNSVGLYFYYFTFPDFVFLGCAKFRRAAVTNHPVSWQITVYDENYHTPDWFKGGLMYQIFPDRFYKEGEIPIAPYKTLRDDWGGCPAFRPNQYGKILNNDFFGGNLKGVLAKLDHLQKLHVSVIYFNPIFAAYSNHRYDTGDYLAIDPLLGTSEDLDRLVEEGKKRGIRIILDGVFNHTGDDSRYFNKYGRYDSVGAYQSQSSPYAGWYQFYRFPDSYDSWWGMETLPAVNEASASYQNFICGEDGVLKHWLSHGIGGYRLDVADELPDFFLRLIRTSVKEKDPEAVIIGEVWEDASNKIAYGSRREYLQGYELDSVMNYPLKDGIISYILSGNSDQLRETVAMLIDNYPKETVDSLMNLLGTHDTPRILTVLGGKYCSNKEEMAATKLSEEEKKAAKKKLKMAAVLQFTLPGVPSIYYGDEAGMEGYSDPFCRGCFPWENIDESLEAFYRKLGEIRMEKFPEIFRDGTFREIFADRACLVYERRKGDAAVYIYCNNSAEKYALRLEGEFVENISGKNYRDHVEIGAYSYGILSRIK